MCRSFLSYVVITMDFVLFMSTSSSKGLFVILKPFSELEVLDTITLSSL